MADLTRQLISADLALHMQRKGYDTGIAKVTGEYVVYGARTNGR